MDIQLRTATLHDVAFLVDVVVTAIRAQGRFPSDVDLAEYRTRYEDWTRKMVLGSIPNCTLSVIEHNGIAVGRLRVLRDDNSLTLAGIQLLPAHQNKRIGSTLVEHLKHEADQKGVPLHIAVEKDNPHAQRFYHRLGCVRYGEDEEEYHLEYRPRASNH